LQYADDVQRLGKMPVPLIGKTDAAPVKSFAENALKPSLKVE
jgi:hypothetical protein